MLFSLLYEPKWKMNVSSHEFQLGDIQLMNLSEIGFIALSVSRVEKSEY